MKNIRTFIAGSSLLLVAWLAASYSTEIENATSFSESAESTKVNTEKPVAEVADTKKETVTTTASLAGIE